MATDPTSEPSETAPLEISGEEDIGGQSTPNKDLASALVIAALSVVTMIFSLRLDVPGSFYTAPGLLPFVTGASLLLMAVVLGSRAVRGGAVIKPLSGVLSAPPRALRDYLAEEESRRTIFLMTIVIGYVLLVAFVSFDLRLPTPVFVFRLSSYEVISVVMVTWILRLFWKASVTRCFIVTLITVEALASIFRYGFGILMPETF